MQRAKTPSGTDLPFLAWTQEYSVKVPAFDQEHARIFHMISGIHAAAQDRTDRPTLQRLVEEVIKETRHHFDHEEGVMTKSAYPGFRDHAAKHEALIQEAVHLSRQFRDGYISALILPTFLKKWFIEHIYESDRAYAAHLWKQPIQ